MTAIVEPPLDVCGCCQRTPCDCATTDGAPLNRPGLPAIQFRVGKHSTFFQRMVDALSTFELTDEDGTKRRPLARLTERSIGDPSIALLDAFAVVGDVLTFYQERIANEGYLRTATERRSVLELAREIGYELNPGVAASTYLAFTVEDAPSAPKSALVPKGTKIQSVPGPGELPQTFETISDFTARVEWNALRPQAVQPQNLVIKKHRLYLTQLPVPPHHPKVDAQGNPIPPLETEHAAHEPRPDVHGAVKTTPPPGTVSKHSGRRRWLAHSIFLQGVSLNFKEADVLLVEQSGQVLPIVVRKVTEDAIAGRTRLDVLPGAPPSLPTIALPSMPSLVDVGQPKKPVAQTLDDVRTWILGLEWSELELQSFLATQKWDAATLLTQVTTLIASQLQVGATIYMFRQRLGFFGTQAPAWKSLPLPPASPNPESNPPPNPMPTPLGYPKDWDHPPISIWEDGTTPRNTQTRTQLRPSGHRRTQERSFDQYTRTGRSDVFLEREVSDLVANSWVVFERPRRAPTPPKRSQAPEALEDRFIPYLVTEVAQTSRADFAMSGKTTGLRLAEPVAHHMRQRARKSSTPKLTYHGVLLAQRPGNKAYEFEMRRSIAYVQARTVTLATMPFEEPIEERVLTPDGRATELVPAQRVTLDRLVLGLKLGQPVMVSGIEAGDAAAPSTGVQRNEVAFLHSITHAHGYTTLELNDRLQYRYLRETFTINANVALATHGETVANEILGSGDGSQVNQRFTLRKSPLTYISAATPTGSQSTLTVRVNGVAWTEVPYLYGLGPRGQNYAVRIADDSTASVVFGDGLQGARLPRGQENVVATYRNGIGPAGEVGPRKLTLLLNKPLGVKSVVNPLAASGAAAPETLDSARTNAPRTVLTLGRIVSLEDFEDFARGFAGIGKAKVDVLWSGHARIVHLTLAGPRGETVDEKSNTTLFDNLKAAIQEFSDGTDEVRLSSYRPAPFQLAAEYEVDAARDPAVVGAAVTAAVTQAFSFDARTLGAPVTESEVMTVIQSVPGVVFTRIKLLQQPNDTAAVEGVLVAEQAHPDPERKCGDTGFCGAQLLTLSPTGLTLTQVTS
jgi:predicted phage baseplate assembly protein